MQGLNQQYAEYAKTVNLHSGKACEVAAGKVETYEQYAVNLLVSCLVLAESIADVRTIAATARIGGIAIGTNSQSWGEGLNTGKWTFGFNRPVKLSRRWWDKDRLPARKQYKAQ